MNPSFDPKDEPIEYDPREQEETPEPAIEPQGMSQAEFDKIKMPEGPKFTFNLPPDHFLSKLAEYGKAISDAYAVYWFMSGLFMLGTVSNKKIKFVTKMDTFYANLWIYILGDSSLARKSTAVKKAIAMLRAVLGDRFANACVPNSFSYEAFIEHMSNYQHAPWVRDEAAGILAIMHKDYMNGFKEDLMQLFDCQPITRMLRTKKGAEKSRFNIDDPFLNMFFASTGAALGYNLDLIDKETGFLVRFMFAYPQDEKEGEYMPLAKGTALHSEFEEICISQLTTLHAQMESITECIDMSMSPNAEAYYNRWQEVREKAYARLKDGYSSQIFSRLNPAVIKMSMLLEMGSMDFDPTRPIREEYVIECCRLVDSYFMPTTRNVYDSIGSANKENQIEKIELYLSRHGSKATRNEIMQNVKIKSKEMTEYLATMHECGLTRIEKVWNPTTKKNTSFVVLQGRKIDALGKIDEIGRIGRIDDIKKLDKCDSDVILPTSPISPTLPKSPILHNKTEEIVATTVKPSCVVVEGAVEEHRQNKRKCHQCNREFPYDLSYHYNGDQSGFECSSCFMGQPVTEKKVAAKTVKDIQKTL